VVDRRPLPSRRRPDAASGSSRGTWPLSAPDRTGCEPPTSHWLRSKRQQRARIAAILRREFHGRCITQFGPQVADLQIQAVITEQRPATPTAPAPSHKPWPEATASLANVFGAGWADAAFTFNRSRPACAGSG
jgi:hypothetical protein